MVVLGKVGIAEAEDQSRLSLFLLALLLLLPAEEALGRAVVGVAARRVGLTLTNDTDLQKAGVFLHWKTFLLLAEIFGILSKRVVYDNFG